MQIHNPMTLPTPHRRGSVYILVVAVLVLLALIGTAFVTTARVDRISVDSYADNTQFELSADALLSTVSEQLINDLFITDEATGALVYRAYGQDHHDAPHGELDEILIAKPDPLLASRVPVDLEMTWDASSLRLKLVPDAAAAMPAWPHLTAPLLDGIFDSPSANVLSDNDVSTAGLISGDEYPMQAVGFWPDVYPVRYPDGTSLVAPVLNYIWVDDSGVTPVPVPGRIFAADADGDGIPDAGLEKLDWDPGNGLTYYVGFRIIDHNSAVNVSTAWAHNQDADLPGNFFPSHLNLYSEDGGGVVHSFLRDSLDNADPRYLPTAAGQMAALNRHRNNYLPADSGGTPLDAHDPYNYFVLAQPYDDDHDDDGAPEPIESSDWPTSGWPYNYDLLPGGQEELWIGLGRRLGNPGWWSATPVQYQSFALSDAVALASRFTLSRQDASVSAGNFSNLEHRLRPTLVERTRSQPYSLSNTRVGSTDQGVYDWFMENFSYWSEGNGSAADAFDDLATPMPPEDPTVPATLRNRRALLTTMNGVANHSKAATSNAISRVAPVRGMMAYAALGLWDPDVQYKVGDVVWDEAPSNGNSNNYICINVNGSLGAGGATGERPSDDSGNVYWVVFDSLIYLDTWESSTTYAEHAMVRYRTGQYLSRVGGNTGNTPDSSPTEWAPVQSPWASTFNYPEKAFILYEGRYYISLQGWNSATPVDNIGYTPDENPDFWRPTAVPPIRKTNLNQAHFRELWRAFYNVMAVDVNVGFPFELATAGYMAAAKEEDEANTTDSVLSSTYTYHDPYVGNKYNPLWTDPDNNLVYDLAESAAITTWGDPTDPPQHPARQFRSPIRQSPYLDSPTTPLVVDPLYDAQTKRLSPKQVTALRSALAAVNTEDLRDSDFNVTARQIELYVPRVIRGTVGAVDTVTYPDGRKFELTFTDPDNYKYDDYYDNGEWVLRFPGTHGTADLRGEEREVDDYDWDGTTASITLEEGFTDPSGAPVTPSGDFFLINTERGTPVDVTVYGYEPQPFITEVYANTDTAYGPEGYLAIELYNPYDFPMYLGGCRVARIDRQRRDPLAAVPDPLVGHLVFTTVFDFASGLAVDNNGASNTYVPGYIPPKGYMVLETYSVADASTSRPATVTPVAAANYVHVPGLGDVVESGVTPDGQELVLLRPRWATLTYDLDDLDGDTTYGGYVMRYDVPTGAIANTWDMVPMDQFDFTGLSTAISEEWHYVRENPGDGGTPGIPPWRFVYPGRYIGEFGIEGTRDGVGGDLITYGRHQGTLAVRGGGSLPNSPGSAGPSIIPIALGTADDRASYPDGVTIQLGGNDQWLLQAPTGSTTYQFFKDWPGPNGLSLQTTLDVITSSSPAVTAETLGPAKFPFGGFARVGDVLQVPFIGAYKMKLQNPTDEPWIDGNGDGVLDPGEPAAALPAGADDDLGTTTVAEGFLLELNSLPMDAAFAEDTDSTSPGEDKDADGVVDWEWDDVDGDGTFDSGEYVAEDFDISNAATAGESEDLNDDGIITAELNTENALEQVGRFNPILNDFDKVIRGDAEMTSPTTAVVASLIDPTATSDRYDNYLCALENLTVTDSLGAPVEVDRWRTVVDFDPATGALTLDYTVLHTGEVLPAGATADVELDRRRYSWAKDVLEYFSVSTPAQDYLPDIPAAVKEWRPSTPYAHGERVWAHGSQFIRKADVEPSPTTDGALTAADRWHVSPATIPPLEDQYWGGTGSTTYAHVWQRIDRQPVANGPVVDKSLANGSDEANVPTEGLININTAPAPVLATLPMVVNPATGVPDATAVPFRPDGATYAQLNRELAQKIVYFRDIDADLSKPGFQPHGAFTSLMQLNMVPGFQKAMGTIVPFAAVGPTDGALDDPDQDPDDFDGDLSPYNPVVELDPDYATASEADKALMEQDGVYNDFEHQWLVLNRISNLVTLRSDVYTCYMVIQGWKNVNRTDTAPILVEEKRFAFILDRSGLSPSSRDVKVIPVPTE